MIHVVGVSMPRSGHHLFEMLLKNTLGDKCSYCEFYEKGCCKSIPCKSKVKTSGGKHKVFLQKSHDFNFSDQIAIPGTFRVVQYRSPVSRSLSNYELYLMTHPEDNIRTFRSFLVDEALYFCKFYQKWIKTPSSKLFILTYEELTADPFRALLRFFSHIKFPINLDQLSAGIARSIGHRGRDNVPFKLTEVLAHRYATYPALANFEELVIRNCPGYFPIRYFYSDDCDNSLIGLIFRAKKAVETADYELATALAEAAYVQDRHDPALAKLCESARPISIRLGSTASGERPARPQPEIPFDPEQQR